MARIAGVDLPANKRVEIGLTYIYGIGRKTSNIILKATNIDPDIRVKDLDESQVQAIRQYLENNKEDIRIEGELRTYVKQNIASLKSIGCYRGIRHRMKLPCRGQNTKQNARTVKGPRRAATVKKK